MSGARLVQPALAILLAVVALNAFGGGAYGLAGADGVPRAWLEGSPFTTYAVPSLVLLVVVGGACAAAAAAVALRARVARRAAIGAGIVCVTWIAAQLAIIGFVSWLQPAVAIAGAGMVALGRRVSQPAPAAEQDADRERE